VKPRITDVCHIDGSLLDAVMHPPAVRKFIQDSYLAVLQAAKTFVEEFSLDRGIDGDQVNLEEVLIDWHRGEIRTTVAMELKLKFELVNNQLRIIEVGFND
jgi:hypothetical protein